MSSDPRVFVSYSSRDWHTNILVQLLRSRLSQQPLDVFNYERPEGRIRSGQSIETACKLEIEKANYCLIIVTNEAFRSEWTQKEVEYALSLGRMNYIFPIILTNERYWPPPYDQLLEIKALFISDSSQSETATQSQENVEKLIQQFCLDQNIRYLPPEIDLYRIALTKRVYSEIYAAGYSNINQELTNRNIDFIFHHCRTFKEYYRQRNLEKAKKVLERIIDDMLEFFPGINPRYPKIMSIVVSLKLSIERGYEEEELLILKSETNALINEIDLSNGAEAFSLLGNIDLELGNYDLALKNFEKAETYLSTPEPALIHNKILSMVPNNQVNHLENLLNELSSKLEGSAVSKPGDLLRLKIVYAIGLCHLGYLHKAIDKFRIAVLDSEIDPAISDEDIDLINYFIDKAAESAKENYDRNSFCNILKLVSQIESKANNLSLVNFISILQREAYLAVEFGGNEIAIRSIHKMLSIEDCNNSVAILVHTALIYHACDRNEEATQCIKRAFGITTKKQVISISDDDFEYYRGYAAWLLLKDEIASECFNRIKYKRNYKFYNEVSNWIHRDELNG